MSEFFFIAENINIMSKTIGPAMRNGEKGPIQKMAEELTKAGADGTYYHGLYMFDAATNLVAVEDAHVATGNLGADRDNNYGSNTTLELKHGIESNDYTGRPT